MALAIRVAQLAQQHRRGDLAGLNGKGHLHQVFPMRAEQLPADLLAEETIDMPVALAARPAELQLLPFADARQQMNSQQMREGEDGSRLALRI